MNRFFTFGAGEKFIQASQRLEEQAIKTGIFDEIVVYSDTDLKAMSEFWSVHGNFVENNPRMYGYGIWKPFLVLKELEGLDDGDRLFYADSGCEFDLHCENPKEEYEALVKHMDKYKIIATLCNWDRHMNKMDLVKYLNMEDHPGFMTEQIQATTFIIEKNENTVALVKEWYDTCCIYHLVNDEPSVASNRPDYDEHRHEQSILSLLLKKRGFYDIPKEITVESVICMSRNRSNIHFPACRVTGSNFYSLHFGDDFIEGNQIIHMSNIVRQVNPQYILETGFGSGRTGATIIQSCRKLPILKFVNCEQNYSLQYPVSNTFRDYFKAMCPYYKTFESRSFELLRTSFLKTEFPNGINWFTVDGSPTYEGCLCELISVLNHMTVGSVIYVVSDRNKMINFNMRDACDFFGEMFSSKVTKILDDVVGREICYFKVK